MYRGTKLNETKAHIRIEMTAVEVGLTTTSLESMNIKKWNGPWGFYQFEKLGNSVISSFVV